MTERYLRAKQSQVSWGIEGTQYSKAATLTSPFGLITDDITWPVANPRTAKATVGGNRGPHMYSKDDWDLKFSIPFEIQNSTVPFDAAIGAKAAISGTGYTGQKWEEDDILTTVTVEHDQKDAAFSEWYIGCKADLNLSAKRGEAVKATMDFTAASYDVDTAAAAWPEVTVPTTQPFRFWMLDDVTASNGAGVSGSIVNINSFDLSWKNGCAARGHAGDASRGAYCVVEEEAAGRYDMKLNVTIADNTWLDHAIDNETAIDIVIPLLRTGSAVASATDALIIYLNDCVILDAGIPTPAKGDLQTDITVGPLTTSIHIRDPTA